MTFLRVGIIVAITACAVYFGLNLLFPRNQPEKQQGAATTPAQVFGTTESATPAPPPGQAQTQAQGLSEAEARKIAEDVGRKVGTQVAQSVVEQQKGQNQPAPASSAPAQPSAQPSSSEQPAASSPPPSEAPASPPPSQASATPPPAESAPAAQAEPTPPPAEEQAAAPDAPAPAKHEHKHKAPATAVASAAESGKAAPKGKGKREPDADAITAWWPKTDQQSSTHLNLVYAGEAAFDDAAVVMFSSPVDPSAGGHIQVLDSHGRAVKGSWERGGNPRMLLFKTKPGRYTLVLSSDLADTSGKTLGTGLHGPVYVH
jgi:hypothetical protein